MVGAGRRRYRRLAHRLGKRALTRKIPSRCPLPPNRHGSFRANPVAHRYDVAKMTILLEDIIPGCATRRSRSAAHNTVWS